MFCGYGSLAVSRTPCPAQRPVPAVLRGAEAAGCAPPGPLPVPAAGEAHPPVEAKVWGWSGIVFKGRFGNVSAASQEQRVWEKQT